MAKRIQVGDPLLGASPALRPMARPLQVTPGATPPPQRSPLMELADSFRGVNAELRDLLRDVAAQEERDAEALGEIEASRAIREGKLAELDKALKAKVDAGELPSVRLPAAQRAAAFRVGHEHAEVGLRNFLYSKINDAVASKPEQVEEIIRSGAAQYSDALSPDAFYERMAFERTAQEVVGSFRKRVSDLQTVRAEEAQKQLRASEWTELLHQTATADADAVPDALSRIKLSLDSVRDNEIPKTEINKVFTAEAVRPVLNNLLLKKDWDGAKQLIQTLETLDLTGKGGLYGKTAEGSAVLLDYSRAVLSREKEERFLRANDLQAERLEAEETATQRAAQAIYQARQENGGDLPEAIREKLLNDSGLKDQADLTYRRIVTAEFENAEKARLNQAEGARLLREIDTFDTEVLDLKLAETRQKAEQGIVSFALLAEVENTARRNRALIGALTEQDFKAFRRDVFEVSGLTPGTTTIDVGDLNAADIWTTISPELREEVQQGALEAFRAAAIEQLRLRSEGKPENVPQIKEAALTAARTAAQKKAQSLLIGVQQKQREIETRAAEAAQARAIRQARARETLSGSAFADELDFTRNAQDFRAVPRVSLRDPEVKKAVAADQRLPRAERDFASVGFRSKGLLYPFKGLKDYSLVNLAETAKAAETDEESRAVYAVAKARLGFTPEEVKKGVTKHGVAFSPSQIDPKRISVFRSVAELNRHWSNGQFDETFGELGDLIDPNDSMTPEEFYLAQLALLSK